MPYLLRPIRIDSIGFVDVGANPGAEVAFWKSADDRTHEGMDMSEKNNAAVQFGKLKELAGQLQKADPNLTYPDALAKARRIDPDLSRAYERAMQESPRATVADIAKRDSAKAELLRKYGHSSAEEAVIAIAKHVSPSDLAKGVIKVAEDHPKLYGIYLDERRAKGWRT